MRIAVLLNAAPRKLGSFEGWITALCQQARARGHQIDVYSRAPVHEALAARLAKLGAGWSPVETLERSSFGAIRTLSSYDVIHLNLFGPRSKVALCAYAALPARVLWVDHSAGPIPSERPRPSALAAFLQSTADAITEFRLTGVACVSEHVSERNRRRFSAKKVKTIYNGVDLKRFVSRDDFFDVSPGKPQLEARRDLKVLAVSPLDRSQGIAYLLRGMSRAKNKELTLQVVGEGPELPVLQKLTQLLGLASRVQFLGARDDVETLMRACDIVVQPSICEEAFGQSVAEAMSAQKAIIASRIGAIREQVEHGVQGLLVTPERASEISEALDLLSSDPQLRWQLGQNARQRAVEQFSVNKSAQEHVRWCETVSAAPARRQLTATTTGISGSVH